MICRFVRRFRALAIPGAIACAFMLVLTVEAQSAPAPAVDTGSSITEMSIEDLMNVTVFTSGKKAESASKTAAAVFVITRDDIIRYGYTTLAQALKRISGFYSEYDHVYDYIGLRGYLPNNDLNRRVLVLIDGHRVNDYLYGQAPVNQDLPVDMRDLERIEIVKGPGSSLWGSEALLCVINCITRRAADMNGLNLGQDLGWIQGQHFTFGQANPGGFEVSASVGHLDSDGEDKIYFPDFDDPADNNGIAQGLDGEHVRRGFIGMKYKGLSLFYEHNKRTKDVPTAYWGSVFNTPGVGMTDERAYWELSWENQKPFAGDGKLFARIYKDDYDAVGNWNWIDDSLSEPLLIYNRGIDTSRAYGGEVRYSRSLSSRLAATFGTELIRTYKTKRINFDIDPYILYTLREGEYTLISYYLQADWDIASYLRLVAGTRFDDNSVFGDNWCPRAGLIYNRSSKSTLKLLYGEAFRMPSISESRTDDNPFNLHPEKISTTELVWERHNGNGSRFVTSLFSFDMRDMIRRVHGAPANVDRIESVGIESQYECHFRNGGAGYVGLSYVNAQSANPNYHLPSSPHWLATGGANIPVFGEKAYLAGELRYVSTTDTNLHNRAGQYAVANLTLTSSSILKNAEFSLGITNLFNTPVVCNARPEDYQDAIPQPMRALQFWLTYRP